MFYKMYTVKYDLFVFRWLVQSVEDPMRQGWVPAALLSSHEDSPDTMRPKDARFNRE